MSRTGSTPLTAAKDGLHISLITAMQFISLILPRGAVQRGSLPPILSSRYQSASLNRSVRCLPSWLREIEKAIIRGGDVSRARDPSFP